MTFCVFPDLLAQAIILALLFDIANIAALDMFRIDFIGKSFSLFRVLNIYHVWSNRTSQMTVSRLVEFPDSSHTTLVVGDFNIYHLLPNPLHSH